MVAITRARITALHARNLATLSQPAAPTSTLTPPYSHSINSAQPKFRPPYAHSISTPTTAKLAAPYKYSLIPPSRAHDEQRVESFNTWAKGLLQSQEGRERVWKAWVESVIELEKIKSIGNHIPQVAFHSLAAHLTSESTLEAIKTTGTLVVRDVVADAEAQGLARSLLSAIDRRAGKPLYWHESLLSARSHPSVLSASNQLLSALTGHTQEALIQADAAQMGITSAGSRTTQTDSPWSVDEQSLAPTTPLLSHLALTPSSAGSLPATIAAATYSTLRPFFQPVRSQISFYDKTSYLDPTNWRLVDGADMPSYPTGATPNFPHLTDANVSIPGLNAGDMVFRHSALPVLPAKEEGIFVPLTPLPQVRANVEYVQTQREAFENGLPPVHARDSAAGLVELETAGERGMIKSSGGKRAMGYV